MNWFGWVLVVLIFLFWVRYSFERSRCTSRHPKWGRCNRKPYHFPHPHTGWRGGMWR